MLVALVVIGVLQKKGGFAPSTIGFQKMGGDVYRQNNMSDILISSKISLIVQYIHYYKLT